jgi:hypothetical protein
VTLALQLLLCCCKLCVAAVLLLLLLADINRAITNAVRAPYP